MIFTFASFSIRELALVRVVSRPVRPNDMSSHGGPWVPAVTAFACVCGKPRCQQAPGYRPTSTTLRVPPYEYHPTRTTLRVRPVVRRLLGLGNIGEWSGGRVRVDGRRQDVQQHVSRVPPGEYDPTSTTLRRSGRSSTRTWARLREPAFVIFQMIFIFALLFTLSLFRNPHKTLRSFQMVFTFASLCTLSLFRNSQKTLRIFQMIFTFASLVTL